MIYRKMEPADILVFVALRKRQLTEEGAVADVDITQASTDYYETCLLDGTFASWLAVEGGDIIATSGISIVRRPPTFGNPAGRIGLVSSMYTLPPYRRKGIAKRLLGLVVDEARLRGCGAVHVTASDAGLPFYRDFGFTVNPNFLQYPLPPEG